MFHSIFHSVSSMWWIYFFTCLHVRLSGTSLHGYEIVPALQSFITSWVIVCMQGRDWQEVGEVLSDICTPKRSLVLVPSHLLVLMYIFFTSLAQKRNDWYNRCLNAKVISNIIYLCPVVHLNLTSVAQRLSLPKIDTNWHLRVTQYW